MKHLTKLTASLLLITMLFGFTGCNILTRLTAKDSDKMVEVTSEDGALSITIPENWNKKDSDLHEEADIAVSNRIKEEYIIILKESKVDFEEGFTLDDYFELVKGNFDETVEDAEAGTPEKTKIGAYDAVSYELKGSVNGIKITYFINYVDTGSYFNQVIGWTLYSKTEENRKLIKDIIGTLKENVSEE